MEQRSYKGLEKKKATKKRKKKREIFSEEREDFEQERSSESRRDETVGAQLRFVVSFFRPVLKKW